MTPRDVTPADLGIGPPAHWRLAVESLTEDVLRLESERDDARGEAELYRLLALAALDYCRRLAVTRDDGRSRHIACYVDRRVAEAA